MDTNQLYILLRQAIDKENQIEQANALNILSQNIESNALNIFFLLAKIYLSDQKSEFFLVLIKRCLIVIDDKTENGSVIDILNTDNENLFISLFNRTVELIETYPVESANLLLTIAGIALIDNAQLLVSIMNRINEVFTSCHSFRVFHGILLFYCYFTDEYKDIGTEVIQQIIINVFNIFHHTQATSDVKNICLRILRNLSSEDEFMQNQQIILNLLELLDTVYDDDNMKNESLLLYSKIVRHNYIAFSNIASSVIIKLFQYLKRTEINDETLISFSKLIKNVAKSEYHLNENLKIISTNFVDISSAISQTITRRKSDEIYGDGWIIDNYVNTLKWICKCDPDRGLQYCIQYFNENIYNEQFNIKDSAMSHLFVAVTLVYEGEVKANVIGMITSLLFTTISNLNIFNNCFSPCIFDNLYIILGVIIKIYSDNGIIGEIVDALTQLIQPTIQLIANENSLSFSAKEFLIAIIEKGNVSLMTNLFPLLLPLIENQNQHFVSDISQILCSLVREEKVIDNVKQLFHSLTDLFKRSIEVQNVNRESIIELHTNFLSKTKDLCGNEESVVDFLFNIFNKTNELSIEAFEFITECYYVIYYRKNRDTSSFSLIAKTYFKVMFFLLKMHQNCSDVSRALSCFETVSHYFIDDVKQHIPSLAEFIFENVQVWMAKSFPESCSSYIRLFYILYNDEEYGSVIQQFEPIRIIQNINMLVVSQNKDILKEISQLYISMLNGKIFGHIGDAYIQWIDSYKLFIQHTVGMIGNSTYNSVDFIKDTQIIEFLRCLEEKFGSEIFLDLLQEESFLSSLLSIREIDAQCQSKLAELLLKYEINVDE